METNTIKTIKSFDTIEKILNYCKKINHPDNEIALIKEINKKALIKYGCILILFDPYNILND